MAISFLPILLFSVLLVYFISRALFGKGKPVLSEPYCAKCGYDLRVNWDSSMTCPECGADLQAKNAVNFGKVRRSLIRPWMVILFCVMFLLLILSFLTGFRVSSRSVASPAVMVNQSSAQIIANLPTTWNEPWAWMELEKRYKAGKVTTAELDQIVAALVTELNKKDYPDRAPLHHGGQFIAKLIIDHKISDSKSASILRAYYMMPGKLIRKEQSDRDGFAAFHVEASHTWALGGYSQLDPRTVLRFVTYSDDQDARLIFGSRAQLNNGIKDNIAQTPTLMNHGDMIYIEKSQLKVGQYDLLLQFDSYHYTTVLANKQPGENDEPIAKHDHAVWVRVMVDEDHNVSAKPMVMTNGK